MVYWIVILSLVLILLTLKRKRTAVALATGTGSDQPQKIATRGIENPFYWMIMCGLFALLTAVWDVSCQMDYSIRKGAQLSFGTSPQFWHSWEYFSVDVLLLLQAFLIIPALFCCAKEKWKLLPTLGLLWLLTLWCCQFGTLAATLKSGFSS